MRLPRLVAALTLPIALTACALNHVMPPFSLTYVNAVESPATPLAPHSLPAARTFAHKKKILREHDTATDQTRVSVTTHRGAYFLWMQRPRITFFYVYAGNTPSQTPGTVFLVFRTVYPQQPATNRLTLTCDGTARDLGITPTFWFEPGAIATSQHYMYKVPLATLAELMTCSSTSLAVGDVTAPFAPDQIEALRDFAAGAR
jgi:hypothetical protein